MPTRITVTRSPTQGGNSDDKEKDNITPVVLSFDEIPSKPSNEVLNRDNGSIAPGNEEKQAEESDGDDEQPATPFAATFTATATNAVTTDSEADGTTVKTDTTTTAFAKSSPAASGSNTAKNISEFGEEKKEETLVEEEEDTAKEEIIGGFKKVRRLSQIRLDRLLFSTLQYCA